MSLPASIRVCSGIASVLLLTHCAGDDEHPRGGSGASGSATGGVMSSGGTTPGAGTGGTSAGGMPGTGGSNAQGGSVTAGSNSAGGSAGVAGDDSGSDQCPAAPLGAVSFSVPSGTFQGSVSVELTAAEAGAEIRYTTDRTPPTATSALYAGAIELTMTTDLRAQAFVAGAPVGEPAAAVYVARAFDQAHDLPVIVLDSYGVPLPPEVMGQTADREYIDAAALTFAPSATGSLAQVPTVASPSGFHVRGQSSATYAKKPYKLEFREGDGSDRNCPMLGMPRDEDWVLHAPYPDKALIRNAFVYSLGRELNVKGPRAEFVELYVNTAGTPLAAGDYQGVYLLTETIKNQKDRLNLQQLEPTDVALPAISGGYIFKLEYKVMGMTQELMCPAEQANCWDVLEVTDPEPWNAEQQTFLSQYISQFATALHSPAPADPATGYPAFMDTPSFVDQVIVNELTRNMDSYIRSQFFHKDRDGKIFAGPLWDYDLTFGVGTSDKYANLAIEGWEYEANDVRFDTTADWFPVLLAEPTFKAALVTRYKELRQGLLSDAQVTARITKLTAGLAMAAARNFTKWTVLETARIGFFETPVDPTWEGQVTAMQTWMLARLAWLDTQWQ